MVEGEEQNSKKKEVKGHAKHHNGLKERVGKHLTKYGGSIVINYSYPIINVHVHTDEPDLVMDYFFENISDKPKDIIVENLEDQIKKEEEKYKNIPISVSSKDLSDLAKKVYHNQHDQKRRDN